MSANIRPRPSGSLFPTCSGARLGAGLLPECFCSLLLPLLLLGTPLSGPAPAEAQDPLADVGPLARAVRVESPPVLDGRLDEAVWRQALPLGGFTQTEPEAGVPASEPTQVRIVYTRTTLFLAFLCEDAEADALRPMQLRWDGDLTGDDRVEVILDTFGDRRSAYSFTFTPAGAQRDAQIREEGAAVNLSWDGVWYVATDIGSGGWTAEVAIPFSTLRFTPGGTQRWGFNIERVLRRRNEYSYWAPLERGLGSLGVEGKYRLAYAGTLTGLEGIQPGSRWELKPYLLGSLDDPDGTEPGEAPISGFEPDAELGLDARLMLGSGFSLDATLNTDFAQVEADQEQMQIDRFPLFYPEKREFFTENHDLFTFGLGEYNATPPFQLFYSRRIGLTPPIYGERYAVPIEGGVRLTGKNGPWSVGALAVQTAPLQPDLSLSGIVEDYRQSRLRQGVLRVSRDVLGRSRVGVMLLGAMAQPLPGEVGTSLSPPVDYAAGGLDATFSLFRNTQVTGFVAGARHQGEETAPAAALNYSWNTDRWGLNLVNLYVDEDWADDMGFVRRTGTLRNTVELSWSPRPDWPGVRQLMVFADTDYFTRPDGRLESRSLSPGLVLLLDNGGQVVLGAEARYEYLAEAFSLRSGSDQPLLFPAGVHDWTDFFLYLGTSAAAPVGATVTVAGGPYYAADRRTVFGSLWWQPQARWRLEGEFFSNRIEGEDVYGASTLYEGEVLAARVAWTPSVRTLVKLFTQVNTASVGGESGNLNLLFAWRYRPRSWFYLVWNDAFREAWTGGDWRSSERVLMLKWTYLWNL